MQKKIYQFILKDKVNESIIKEVNETKSIIALNQGDLNFALSPLPSEVQWSSVNTGIVDDFNADGNIDMILAGGENNLKPQFAKLDSGFASLLLGNGDGTFKFITVENQVYKLKVL